METPIAGRARTRSHADIWRSNIQVRKTPDELAKLIDDKQRRKNAELVCSFFLKSLFRSER